MVDVADIEAAASRLDGVSIRTPLLQNFELDQLARGKVLIKPECLQVTGSFKIRGAYNRLSQLTEKACTMPNERTEPMTKRRIRATMPQRPGGPIHITTIKGDNK